MGEYTEMALEGITCESCGCFISAEPLGHPGQCEDCHEEELHRAANTGDIPDGITYADWEQIRQKYMEPQEAYRE